MKKTLDVVEFLAILACMLEVINFVMSFLSGSPNWLHIPAIGVAFVVVVICQSVRQKNS